MGKYIPEAHCFAFFHGESWFRCPECKFQFEFYDAIYERDGIKKAPEYSAFTASYTVQKALGKSVDAQSIERENPMENYTHHDWYIR